MARPEEPKTVKERIEKAFLDLMDEKPYPDITVTDIINKAEVARVSYYRNFSSIMDIIDSITDKMASDFSRTCSHLFAVSSDTPTSCAISCVFSI